jgi:hypothetical protein
MKIEPVIKVRSKFGRERKVHSERQFSFWNSYPITRGGKKRHGYGMRWMAESAFSSLKRMFGESVKSVKWQNMVNELLLKASIYNALMRIKK